MRISDINNYMSWKSDGMRGPHPWFPVVTDDASCDAAYHDDTVVLSLPPEYVVPEWDPLVPIDWVETHDWTYDYDYDEYYDYEDYVRYERDWDYDDV